MNIAELDDDAIELAYPAMKQLRTDLGGAAELVERVREQRGIGYRLVASFDPSGAVVSVAGFRYAQSLCCGRHLYVDDLSTVPEARGQGHATALLRWIDAEAQRLGCQQVRLDSAPQRHDAHRRYLNSGYLIAALHFAKPVPHSPTQTPHS